MIIRLLILLVLLLGIAGTGLTQNEPSPISNASSSSMTISRQEARWIYTLKTRYWHDGSRITLYHLPYKHPDHQAFVRTVLEMQPSVFSRTIQNNINSGMANIVKEVKNHDDMLNSVGKHAGAIGYLSKDYLLVNGSGHVDILKIID